MNQIVEIERKWLVRHMPSSKVHKPCAEHNIEQIYLSGQRFRLRKKDERYQITYKGIGNLSRNEWEQEIPAWMYTELKPQGIGSVSKTRYVVMDGEQKLEIDSYHGALKGLITIEAEWILELENYLSEDEQSKKIKASEDRAMAYQIPSWIPGSTEVTGKKEYSNRSLATLGLPPNYAHLS